LEVLIYCENSSIISAILLALTLKITSPISRLLSLTFSGSRISVITNELLIIFPEMGAKYLKFLLLKKVLAV
ncbi:hypothetical protein, partial [Zunongwangia profunda]|uniref:hypothetical protein n=1 Tax=Zunongwangia profunda TaxID=398743 RepID=UPI002357BBF6